MKRLLQRGKKELAADKPAAAALAAETAPKPSAETSPASEPASIESAQRSIKEEPPAATGTASELEAAAPTRAIPEEGALETYPVNEPFAYISIKNTKPPRYTVQEDALTTGEKELLNELKTRLYDVVDTTFTETSETEAYLRNKVATILQDLRIKLILESMERIMYYITRDFVGYGTMDAVFRDNLIEDISVDGPDINLYVYHRRYGSLETNVRFNKEELDALIYKMAQRSGRHISLANPMLGSSLPTKDRLQMTIGDEVTTRGSTFTIRKFREVPFSPVDMIRFGSISVEMAAYFWMVVESGSNILFAGVTASGKTSMLNAMSMFIPANSKIVSIEDTREINLLHQNWIPAVTREGSESRRIEMFDLLRSALRQRPEYILVGEVRGREAYTLFQAMATGHFTLSTFHGDSVNAVVRRLTKAPIDVPLMLLDSLDVIVLLGMVKIGDGRGRRVTAVMEVTGVDFDNETLTTNQVFSWRPDEFTFSGESRLFEKIMRKLNLNEEEVSKEFSRRVQILKLLIEQKVTDFERLAGIFFQFNVDPDETERKVREGKL
ncbi:MAG: type II/IV secretion system ATPase subunit [Chloroflexi bacterium]|nr:type II/IV secretion system ATPase subunit [Chloroflexota bacterium]